ncbi:hypothetical protein [Dethiosulfatarculus sandiegensis]|uniref:Uncharacterized protein n=1 Tax=Dethiosulfatarculus sandiegensis TaxID=1429043 RepID=A0A0D2HQH2_9BACT|nr:hypothetical protein [Dethiosulfatarculus sandiegensis]KIX12733.1 hypothetical protein X474_17715 [Dethiosulfatarculus sandiegensis]
MTDMGKGQAEDRLTNRDQASLSAPLISIQPQALALVAKGQGDVRQRWFQAGFLEGEKILPVQEKQANWQLPDLREFLSSLADKGLGELILVEWNPDEARFLGGVRNPPLAELGRDFSSFLAGFWGGLGQCLLGRPTGVEELTCLSSQVDYLLFRVQAETRAPHLVA